MTTPAIPTDSLLDELVLEAAEGWSIRSRRRAFVRESPGGRRLQLAWAPAGFPQVLHRRTFSLSWSNLGPLRDDVLRLLADPGPFTLVLWRREYLSFRGDGRRSDWLLPWPQAVDVAAAIPGGVPADRFTTRARLGLAGSELAVQTLDDAAYDGGSPGAGEVWIRRAGRDLKAGDVLDTAERLFVDIVPAYSVIQGEAPEKTLRDPLLEPLELVLEEV